MNAKGIRVCRIGGVDVIIDYSWVIIFFLLTYSMAETVFPEAHKDYGRLWCWLMGIAASALVFVSILVHELAHSWVSIKRGINVTSVRLFIFGGMAETASEPKDGRDEFLIALAGPAANVLLGVLFSFVFISTMEHMSPVTTIVQWAVVTNMALAFFNLTPGFPLDGGRVLRAFLWDQWNDMARATQVVSRIGDVLAVFMIGFGLLLMIFYKSLLAGIWFICIGFLMKRASGGALQTATAAKTKHEQPPRVTVRQIMKKNPVAVDWLVPVNQFVDDYLYRYFFTEFPVLNRDEFVGIVSLADVSGVAAKLRDFKQVRDIMIPVEQLVAPGPEDDADSVFERMLETDAEFMPVIEEGRLAGIILRRDIANYGQIKISLKQ
ncbi:MAG: site-2 protease family protein [Acidobacteriota bacterium]|jgi:Zn-dependent protease/CBS domain-containing protein|nr:site-2 protease family protein [Acidobacteriota bacterium]